MLPQAGNLLRHGLSQGIAPLAALSDGLNLLTLQFTFSILQDLQLGLHIPMALVHGHFRLLYGGFQCGNPIAQLGLQFLQGLNVLRHPIEQR